MKDRLIEDWLTRINERGYESSFCQILLSQGYQILRCGHSPTEHGKDVLAISPDGAVCAWNVHYATIKFAFLVCRLYLFLGWVMLAEIITVRPLQQRL